MYNSRQNCIIFVIIGIPRIIIIIIVFITLLVHTLDLNHAM